MKTRSWWLLRSVLILSVLGMNACQQAAHNTHRVQRIENGLVTATVIHGQPSPKKLTERMTYYGAPGVSIAVINNGKIEWAKGHGVLEARGTKAVTALTPFQAASISKPLAAMAALSLVEAGKLGLDENVNLELKSWQVTDNEFTKDEKVTLRRLLNHPKRVRLGPVAGWKGKGDELQSRRPE
jgi:CubicO group peptidase (beta-lactamase class C family)